jgi:hypothetical protein
MRKTGEAPEISDRHSQVSLTCANLQSPGRCKSYKRGEVMRALWICGILLFSGGATAQDRSSCFTNCDEDYFTCRHECPTTGLESTACVQRCVQQINECKKQCNVRYPRPAPPKQ